MRKLTKLTQAQRDTIGLHNPYEFFDAKNGGWFLSFSNFMLVLRGVSYTRCLTNG